MLWNEQKRTTHYQCCVQWMISPPTSNTSSTLVKRREKSLMNCCNRENPKLLWSLVLIVVTGTVTFVSFHSFLSFFFFCFHLFLLNFNIDLFLCYSAIRTARLLEDGAKLYSIEMSPLNAAIATKVVEHAGLAHKVKIIIGTGESVIPKLRSKYGIGEYHLVQLHCLVLSLT
jgi:hypothetical protein